MANLSPNDLLIAIRVVADAEEAAKNMNWLATQLKKVEEANARLKKMGMPEIIRPEDIEKIKEMNKQLNNTKTATTKAHQGLISLANVIRTAFGTYLAIVIFTINQAIGNFFKGTLTAAQQFRSEMAELNMAEAILSKRGMDITRSELDDFVKYIEDRYKYLSTLQATKVVADTAGAVEEFDVNKQQLKELADAIAFIQVKNKLLGREEADAAHIINAAMDARSNFFNGMGINITEALIKEKAYAMGLVKAGQEMDKATRFQAVLALLTEQTAGKQQELNDALAESPLGREMAIQKEWADAQLRIGQAFITVKDNIIEMLASWSPELANSVIAFFIDAADRANILIDKMEEMAGAASLLNDALTVVTGSQGESGGFLGWMSEVGKKIQQVFLFPFRSVIAFIQGFVGLVVAPFAGVLTTLVEIASGVPIQQAFEDGGRAVGEAFIRGLSIAAETIGKSGLFKNFPLANTKTDTIRNTQKDTPTGSAPTSILPEIEQQKEDVQGALEKFNQEILEAQIKFGQDMEEAEIDYNRKLADIDIEYDQKRAEAYADYLSKVRDINSSYQDRLAEISSQQQEANQQARNDELEREAKFQEQMRQLKEKFLMDMEDALHERDARQILRLIKQYNLDKAQAEREHALEQEKAKREQEERNTKFANERRDAERERAAKLAEAQQDYQDKLAKLKADEEAERAAAELAFQLKKEDLEREMQNRLEIVAANLINEFNLTKEGLDAIVALYQQYYQEIAGIYAAMNAMLGGMGAIGESQKPNNQLSSNGSGGGGSNMKMAEGGVMVANRPTNVTFGERGMELATFTPINRSGMNTNRVFTNLASSKGGDGGTVQIEMLLSPDLEARVVNNTLSRAGNIITKVQRTKR